MRELNWVYYYANVEKDQNQYTHEECTRVGPVDAKYVKSSNRDFNNNPFIEALPRLLITKLIANTVFKLNCTHN